MISQQLRTSTSWLRRTPLHPQWLLGTRERVGERVRALSSGRVLDIGSADRWVKAWLCRECEYIALDYPATGAALYGARPDIFADAALLPLRSGSIDTVLALEVLEHVRHPREVLHEIARVLRPGGRLLLTMPFLYPLHDAPHDFQRYTLHGLAREIEVAGLRLQGSARQLGSAETAGLIFCLALAGMSLEALRCRSPAMILLPVAALAIPLINALAWLVGKLLPSWPAITAGHEVVAFKP